MLGFGLPHENAPDKFNQDSGHDLDRLSKAPASHRETIALYV